MLPAGRPGEWRTIWADQDADRLPAALGDLASPPLFGGPQVLVVRHADALREEEQALLLERLPSLGAGGSLILVARGADQRRRLFAACLRSGAGFGFPAVDDRTAEAWVGRLARERGCEIDTRAARELVERTGTDLGVLAGELEKLALQAGGSTRRIDPSHVRATVDGLREHRVDEVTDHLTRRDVAGAARALRALLAEGEPPIRLVAFLGANLRRALHVVELEADGLRPDVIAERLRLPPWLVARYRGRGSPAELVRALGVLRRLDLELKSGRPAEAVFDAALLDIARAKPMSA